MRKCHGFSHDHFIGTKPIPASTYFALLELIKYEMEQKKKAMENAEKKNKK